MREKQEKTCENKRERQFPQENCRFSWWRRRGSNSRPYGCEPYALPAELRPRICLLNDYNQKRSECQDEFFIIIDILRLLKN